jgi:UDP-N-acetylglucosamine:LPS N-acetylglucosamine transferase
MAMQGVKQPVHVLHTDPEAWKGEVAMSPLHSGKRIHVGTKDAVGQLVGPDEKKALTGLPVHPDVLKSGKRTGLMDRKSFNVTVSGGGMGLDVAGMARGVLQGLPDNAKVHAVAGKSEKVKRQLERLAKRDPRVQPHGFAPLRQMMREADLNVLRAHGTSFQESVAAGKPAVYYAPDPSAADLQGHLTRSTAEYGERNMGQPAAIGLDKLPKAVTRAVTGKRRLGRLAKRHQKAMGNPADEAVRFIMKPRKEYVKTAQAAVPVGQLEPPPPQEGRISRFLQKAGPGIGGAAGLGIGALIGARRGQLLRGALAGLGTGATLGWVPDMVRGVREGAKELR